MEINNLGSRFVALSKVLHGWLELLTGLEAARRQRIANYADDIASTFARAGQALLLAQAEPDNRLAARRASRELGRIAGYVEDIVALLESFLDGRKLAGVKRRLETLSAYGLAPGLEPKMARRLATGQIDHLAEAEGYFRSLAARLRV